ncbi:MAG: 3-ketosteroid 9alpha-monooxygenase subunit [Nocardioidaceae bacterium]|nr:3-ketosteroid 9alpha-monooxygenase subunit [Nocardioidaceae bacterium]
MARSDHGPHRLTVAAVHVETDDAVSFELTVPPELEDKFHYQPGQYCSIAVTIDGEQVRRSYSLSSSPALGEPFTLTVKRVPEGRLSNWLADHVVAGDPFDLTAPAGTFVLRDRGTPLVAFAAGSGITPIFGVLKTALALTERRVRLLYANRNDRSVIFGAKLAHLQEQYPDRFDLALHSDDDSSFLTQESCVTFLGTDADADVYICGPSAFMDLAETAAVAAGVPAENILIERFDDAPPEVGGGGEDSADDEDGGILATEVEIRLRGSKNTFTYHRGDTILGAARRNGLNPPYSCQLGGCGTCMAMLVEGAVFMHQNDTLDDDEIEEGWTLTCQAVPTTPRVVVDYEA